jgi:hypothetical protein
MTRREARARRRVLCVRPSLATGAQPAAAPFPAAQRSGARAGAPAQRPLFRYSRGGRPRRQRGRRSPRWQCIDGGRLHCSAAARYLLAYGHAKAELVVLLGVVDLG